MRTRTSKPDVSVIYALLGARATEVRGRLGLTQDEVAARAGLSRVSVVQFEIGHQRLPLEAIYLVADALNLEIEQLLPSLNDLAPRPGDIFARLEADTSLSPEARESLKRFFTEAGA